MLVECHRSKSAAIKVSKRGYVNICKTYAAGCSRIGNLDPNNATATRPMQSPDS